MPLDKDILRRLKDNDSTLTELNLQASEIDDEDAEALADTLNNNRSLTSLNLSDNEIGPAGARDLAKALNNNCSLTSLNLCGNYIVDEGAIVDEGVKDLANALNNNRSLTSLDLQGNQIGTPGAKALAKALNNNRSLTSLNLSDNKIGPAGARDLVNASLTKLNLKKNKIGDAGAKDIANALNNNRSLTSLDLQDNQIGTPGAKALAKALNNNRSLTSLDLGNNEINDTRQKAIDVLLEQNKKTALQLAQEKGFKEMAAKLSDVANTARGKDDKDEKQPSSSFTKVTSQLNQKHVSPQAATTSPSNNLQHDMKQPPEQKAKTLGIAAPHAASPTATATPSATAASPSSTAKMDVSASSTPPQQSQPQAAASTSSSPREARPLIPQTLSSDIKIELKEEEKSLAALQLNTEVMANLVANKKQLQEKLEECQKQFEAHNKQLQEKSQEYQKQFEIRNNQLQEQMQEYKEQLDMRNKQLQEKLEEYQKQFDKLNKKMNSTLFKFLDDNSPAVMGAVNKEAAEQKAEDDRKKILTEPSLSYYYSVFMIRFTDIWMACKVIHSGRVADDKASSIDYVVQGLDMLAKNIPFPGVALLKDLLTAGVTLHLQRQKQLEVNNIANFCEGNIIKVANFIEALARRLTLEKEIQIKDLAAKAKASNPDFFKNAWEKLKEIKASLTADDLDNAVKKLAAKDCDDVILKIMASESVLLDTVDSLDSLANTAQVIAPVVADIANDVKQSCPSLSCCVIM